MPVNRGTRVACLLAILLAVSTVVSAPASARTRIRHYAGATSQGERIEIAVKVRDGVVRLSELEIQGSVACEDGTGFGFGGGIGFGGFGGPEIVDRQLEFQDVFLDVGILVSGRLGPVRGSGTLIQTFAMLDADEQAQVCSTGDLTWQVERVAGPAPSSGGRAMLTAKADGVRRWTALEPGLRAEPQLQRQVRNYRGRTSAGGRMQVVTVRREADLALREIAFTWHLSCEDGTDVDMAMAILFGGGVPMEPGRLDLDDVFLNSALHVHGQLGPHLGSGTASQVFAVLTPELDAQLCSSGEVTWDAWRTDAGF